MQRLSITYKLTAMLALLSTAPLVFLVFNRSSQEIVETARQRYVSCEQLALGCSLQLRHQDYHSIELLIDQFMQRTDAIQAVRLVRQLRRELGTEHGTVQRVADQLGYGVETVRKWVKRADVDEGVKPGRSTADAARIKELEQRNRELERTNQILRKASAYFAQAELDRPWK